MCQQELLPGASRDHPRGAAQWPRHACRAGGLNGVAGPGRTTGVVIVGAGHAGGRVAERLRHGGFVGPIDVAGVETELPYERPPLSKGVLTSAGVPANAYLLSPARWNEIGVRFHLGAEAMGIDRREKIVALSNGRSLSYRKLVLATGLSPRRIRSLEPVAARTFYLRSFSDALALRGRIVAGARLVLVGAGLIGLEVAASAVKLGAAVTVLEAAGRPLSRLLPPYLSQWLADLHERAGVRILCDRQVVSSETLDAAGHLHLDDGSMLEADLVVVGIGGTPNDRIAGEADLHVDNGIVVNEFGQTSDPDIFAAGDVAAHENHFFGQRWRLESWKNAEDQAAVVASYLCGSPSPYSEVPWFWTDQYDLNLQVAGMPGIGEPAYERGKPGDRAYLAYFTAGDRLVGAVGVGCGRDIRIAREMIKAGARPDDAELIRKGFARFGDELGRQAS
ncbi:FAD-dependent oxidoreductase [Mesorhizobium sp. B2-8-5]|nr:FAD-dependent oxidoreductase [Mesorhizobium sp. B2-8-5]UCI25829.1 FAD-dependent oxidoreductase [Mesorhizobium sp. B2-8-5]